MDCRSMARLIAVIASILLAAALAGCGGGGGDALVTVDQVAGSSIGTPAESSYRPRPEVQPYRDTALDVALAELEALETPEGVQEALFQSLKAALRDVLIGTGRQRFATAVSADSVNAVTQFAPLDSGPDSIQFQWREKNVGDYDLNGEVWVADITPIGVYFEKDHTDPEWGKAQRADGNGDGRITVSDITPIGQNFLNVIAGYKIFRGPADGEVLDPIADLGRQDAWMVEDAAVVYLFEDEGIEPETGYLYEVAPYHFDEQRVEKIVGGHSEQLQLDSYSAYGYMDAADMATTEIEVEGETVEVLVHEVLVRYDAQPAPAELMDLVYGQLAGRLLGQINNTFTYRVWVHDPENTFTVSQEMFAEGGPTVWPHVVFTLDPPETTGQSTSSVKAAADSSTNPYRDEQWALDAVNAESAWAMLEDWEAISGNSLSDVVVAVIDCGVDIDHEDLAGIWTEVYGHSLDPNPGDENFSHGTHVTGIVAMRDNYVGGVGLASERVRVLPIRTGFPLGDKWIHSEPWVVAAVYDAVDHGADAVNISIGNRFGLYRWLWEGAAEHASDHGVILVAACGNDGLSADDNFPSSLDGYVAVGGVMEEEGTYRRMDYAAGESAVPSGSSCRHFPRAWGSNYGPSVDICAPGGIIFSTVFEGKGLQWCTEVSSNYSYMSGTSMAAPYVSALAGLMLAVSPGMTSAELLGMMQWTGQDIAQDPGKPIGKMIDARAAVAEVLDWDELFAPENIAASDGAYVDRIKVTWDSPDKGAPPQYYVIHRSASQYGGYESQGLVYHPQTTWDDTRVPGEGAYWYRVESIRNGWDNALSGPDSGYLADLQPPEGLTASDGAHDDRIALTWSHPGNGPDPDGYRILRGAVEAGPFVQVDTVLYPAESWDDTTIEDWETYWYLAVSYKAGLDDSGYSDVDSGKVTILNPPRSVNASDGDHADRITISWSHPISGAQPDRYVVYRSPTEQGTYLEVGSTAHPNTSFNDGGVETDDDYWYLVRSKNVIGESADSNKDIGHLRRLEPPRNLTASDGSSISVIAVGWSHPLTGLTPQEYDIYRANTENGTYQLQVSLPYPQTTWEDTSIVDGQHYWYLARSTSTGFTDSADSNKDEGWLKGLNPPLALAASDGAHADKIEVTWSHAGSGQEPDGYKIYRADSQDGTYIYQDSEPYPGTSWDDNDVPNTGDYWYRATAYKSGFDDSVPSNADSGYLAGLQPPSGLSASDGTYTDKIALSWAHPVAGPEPDGYDIYRSASEDGTYTPVHDASYPTSSWDDTSVPDTNIYWYKAVSYKAGYDDSGDSNKDSGKLMGLQPPTSLAATDGDYNDKIEISWSLPGSGPTPDGYSIHRATTQSGTYTQVGTATHPATNWNDEDVPDSDTYWYKAKSYKSGYADSDDSNKDSGYRLPQWTFRIADSTNSTGHYCSMVIVDGRPAISHYDYSNDNLRYVRASNAQGTSWGSPVVVDSTDDVGSFTSMLVVSGNPAIAYHDATNAKLTYVRATDTSGGSWGTPVEAADMGTLTQMSRPISMAMIGTNPAISFYDHAGKALMFVRATSLTGSSWDTPVEVDSSEIYPHVGLHNSLAYVSNRPAIAYYDYGGALNKTKYVWATGSTGSGWNDPINVDELGGQFVDMLIVSGNPAIAEWVSDSPRGGVNYVRSSSSDGSSWPTPGVVHAGASLGQEGVSMAIVNGNPALAYIDGNWHLYYVEATDASGSGWGTPLDVTNSGEAKRLPCLHEVDGHPAIAFMSDEGWYKLKYAILLE